MEKELHPLESEILQQAILYRDEAKRMQRNGPKELDEQAVKQGLQVTARVNKDPDGVPMTPLLKNALIQSGEYGDLPKSEKTGKPMMPLDGPLTKAEEKIMNEIHDLAVKHHGEPRFDYDTTKEPGDPTHYDVDVFRNMLSIGREVTPGASLRRLDQIKDFTKPLKSPDLVALFKEDSDYRKAGTFLADQVGKIVSTAEMSVKGSYAGTGKSNVGYPYFVNDTRTVPGSEGLTYGQMLMERAQYNYSNGYTKEFSDIVYTMGKRDQRGKREKEQVLSKDGNFAESKARLIQGINRVPALGESAVTRPLTEALRSRSVLGYALKSSSDLKEAMIKAGKGLKVNPDYDIQNEDVEKNDTHVLPMELGFAAAVHRSCLIDSSGKSIIDATAPGTIYKQLITPNGVIDIYGKMSSGSGYTGAGTTMITAANKLGQLTKFGHITGEEIASLTLKDIMIFVFGGDDQLSIKRKDTEVPYEEQVEYISRYTLKPNHPKKGEYGLYFFQKRVVEVYGKGYMYEVGTRAINGLFGTEQPKNLGGYGNIIRSYAKFAGLLELKEDLFSDIILLVNKYDDSNGGTVSEDKQKETALTLVEGLKREQASHDENTLTPVWDGDPGKLDIIYNSQNGDVEVGFIQKMFNRIKTIVD